MHDMMNGGGPMDDDLGTTQETQLEGFNIHLEQLFGQDGYPMDDATVMEDKAGNMDDDPVDDNDGATQKKDRRIHFEGGPVPL
jgi:hypothetical protein